MALSEQSRRRPLSLMTVSRGWQSSRWHVSHTVTSSVSEISSPGRTHMMALSPFCSADGNCSARARLRRASTSILLPGKESRDPNHQHQPS